jgi:hypothetical protein
MLNLGVALLAFDGSPESLRSRFVSHNNFRVSHSWSATVNNVTDLHLVRNISICAFRATICKLYFVD